MPTLTVDQLVSREVNCCLSFLVSTLAAGHEAVRISYSGARDLASLAEQAFELASPIDDWEEAAIQAGFVDTGAGWMHEKTADSPYYDSAEEACRDQDIDPYQREVFEHWSVSPWLARQLAAKGERVDHDFAGMAVWARTTSGQGIASDSVIIAIYNEMMAPVEAGR